MIKIGTLLLRFKVILGMIVNCEIIIKPLPILAKIEKVKIETGLVKDSKNTNGKHVTNKKAPKMYTIMYKLISFKQLLLQLLLFYKFKLLRSSSLQILILWAK